MKIAFKLRTLFVMGETPLNWKSSKQTDESLSKSRYVEVFLSLYVWKQTVIVVYIEHCITFPNTVMEMEGCVLWKGGLVKIRRRLWSPSDLRWLLE